MGNNQQEKKGFVQPLILTPTNKTPLEPINIDELISEFEKDPNKYKEYLKKISYVFRRTKQCDSTVNIIENFIPNSSSTADINVICVKESQSSISFADVSSPITIESSSKTSTNISFTFLNISSLSILFFPYKKFRFL